MPPVKRFALSSRSASVVWVEPGRLRAGGRTHPLPDPASQEALSALLKTLPEGPSHWIVEDGMAPAALMRDIVELPAGAEAREAFFRWKFQQALGLQEEFAVQAVPVDESGWLAAGLPLALREAWTAAALKAGRPIAQLQPRWLWLYNRLAPEQERPGMLLSLSPGEAEGHFSGTLAAWSRTLVLVRQWSEAMTPEAWMSERVLPTAAYLQRDGRSPQGLHVWGPSAWPSGELPVRVMQPEIPERETL